MSIHQNWRIWRYLLIKDVDWRSLLLRKSHNQVSISLWPRTRCKCNIEKRRLIATRTTTWWCRWLRGEGSRRGPRWENLRSLQQISRSRWKNYWEWISKSLEGLRLIINLSLKSKTNLSRSLDVKENWVEISVWYEIFKFLNLSMASTPGGSAILLSSY